MKKINLFIYNYGITKIANFDKNFHDATKCMKLFNDEIIQIYGKLSDCTFYYLSYQTKSGEERLYIDYTGSNLYPNEHSIYTTKIKCRLADKDVCNTPAEFHAHSL